MVQAHGMAIRCHKYTEERNIMNFFIQANSPRCTMTFDKDDYDLSTALETVFPLLTEDATLVWNHIYVPLSYKYDISCMIDDILKMLHNIRSSSKGEMSIRWPSNTFASTWCIKWHENAVYLSSEWESVVGQTEKMLNSNKNVTMCSAVFLSEWKKLLQNILQALESCGYKKELQWISTLTIEYEAIPDYGVLYRES